ncbi:hypothetical protein Purlil1_5411 [Purpureocillium lilacinum]|uniref:Uncharacterized protein n=1 Tax=Purpureocillium lilacinum TaxID=33203 RepID=A0ABR0C214_PURLI|nr:hypothetical protein Purlil1_5411 [Purpureocillium lilacinum]
MNSHGPWRHQKLREGEACTEKTIMHATSPRYETETPSSRTPENRRHHIPTYLLVLRTFTKYSTRERVPILQIMDNKPCLKRCCGTRMHASTLAVHPHSLTYSPLSPGYYLSTGRPLIFVTLANAMPYIQAKMRKETQHLTSDCEMGHRGKQRGKTHGDAGAPFPPA